jgi:ATP-dependent DNA ligase
VTPRNEPSTFAFFATHFHTAIDSWASDGKGACAASVMLSAAMPPRQKAKFVEPMECLSVPKLPDGSQWIWELKLDGYRAVGVKSGSRAHLFSRNAKPFDKTFSYIADALADLPDDTTVDGEVVALDDAGRPSFNLLQNFVSEAGRVRYFVFDLLCHKGRDLTALPLIKRRRILSSLKVKSDRIQIADYFEASSEDLLRAARDQHLEGIIGKRRDSVYEVGKRSGSWIKHRLNLGQEFVIGGYTPGTHGVDAIIVGYYRGKGLIYVARTRNGFVPASRRRVFAKLEPLIVPDCPFANLPETRKARWAKR